jgi:hypothetical protein
MAEEGQVEEQPDGTAVVPTDAEDDDIELPPAGQDEPVTTTTAVAEDGEGDIGLA